MRTPIYIRWTIRRDLPEILAIENAVFEYPWSEDDFVRTLRNRNCIGQVAEYGERVVGYMVYELHRARLEILSFAVHPDFQRQGVGRTMMDKLAGKLGGRRNALTAAVRERNLDAQLFMRATGFLATAVVQDFYRDSPEDAYLFERRRPALTTAPQSA